MIRYLNDPNAEAIGDALEGNMHLHVPFEGIKVTLQFQKDRSIGGRDGKCVLYQVPGNEAGEYVSRGLGLAPIGMPGA